MYWLSYGLASPMENRKTSLLVFCFFSFIVIIDLIPSSVVCFYMLKIPVSFQLTNIKIIEYRLVSNIILTLCNIVLKLSNIVLETFWVAFRRRRAWSVTNLQSIREPKWLKFINRRKDFHLYSSRRYFLLHHRDMFRIFLVEYFLKMLLMF